MAFLAGVSIPQRIAYGSKGGPTWRTDVTTLDNGATERIQRWTAPIYAYDLKSGIRTLDDFHDIRDLWMVTAGPVHGFRFHDPFDFTSKPDKPDIHIGTPGSDVEIGVGDGTETQFQLVKRYTYGGQEHTRTISKPVAGTVRIWFGASEQVSGWSVNTETGVVTFTTAPTLATVIRAGFEFEVPVQFEPEMDLGFQPTLSAFKAAELPSILIREVVGDVTTPARRFHGGGTSQTISATTEIHFGMGAAIGLDPTAANTILMPDASALEKGLDYFVMHNRTTNGSYALTFKTHDGATTLWTAAADDEFECVVYDNSGTPAWRALGI
jgi:uncharacterized protein (TIGR02217 family)